MTFFRFASLKKCQIQENLKKNVEVRLIPGVDFIFVHKTHEFLVIFFLYIQDFDHFFKIVGTDHIGFFQNLFDKIAVHIAANKLWP